VGAIESDGVDGLNMNIKIDGVEEGAKEMLAERTSVVGRKGLSEVDTAKSRRLVTSSVGIFRPNGSAVINGDKGINERLRVRGFTKENNELDI